MTAENASSSTTPPVSSVPTHYVGIGASAGGLEAIETFFKAMTSDSDLAFIVIQHLSPDYKSLMSELLSKHTSMPVVPAEEGMPVLANRVYLIPPKKNLKIFHGRLLLSDQDRTRGIILPIDIFLRSLAEDQSEKSIAIILSGTGSDGMRGIRAIKEHGGMVIVQSEESAKFDGMPRSAISTGLADYVLAPEEMPTRLVSYARYPYASKNQLPDRLLTDDDGLTRVFSLLREHSHVDFTFYKPTTVVRRIERRMSLNQLNDLREYVRYLERTPQEVDNLYRELLIGITNFFRDKEAFDILNNELLPELFEHEGHREIRFWVAGCSTGEEAYSLAIIAREAMEKVGKSVSLKIFATDVDRNAILTAGTGIFPESIAADLSPKLLTKYFLPRDENFLISRSIREMVVFAQHNLLKDPPFTKIDLVSCRNLLIYLQPVLQRKALEMFNFSLDNSGLLFLGSSETTGEMSDYFEPLHQKWKLYRCRGRRKPTTILDSAQRTSTSALNLSNARLSLRGGPPVLAEDDRLNERLLKTLSTRYVPLCIIVNQAMEPIHVLGDSSGLFKLPHGKIQADLTKMAIQELSIPLATGIQKVFQQRAPITYTNVRLLVNDQMRVFRLVFDLLPEKKGQIPLAAIFFEEQSSSPANLSNDSEIQGFNLDQQAQQRILDLEQELQFSRENLQATVEELETSNEELQATNEELLASNEELQSTNEELQSVNEELYTVNAEYQSKIVELTQVNNDLDNLLASTQIATIFLDEHFNLRKFTPAAARLFQIIETDIGRPLTHITHNLEDLDLSKELRQVHIDLMPTEREVLSKDGKSYLVRLLPYRTEQQIWAGMVITLINIEPIKAAQRALKRSEQRYAQAQRAAGIGSWFWDIETGSLEWSDMVGEIFGCATADFPKSYDDYLQWVHPMDRAPVDEAVRAALENRSLYEVEHRIQRGGEIRWLLANGNVQLNQRGEPIALSGIVRDITFQRHAEQALNAAHEKLRSNTDTLQGILRITPSGIGLVRQRDFVWVNPAMEQITGYSTQDLVGQSSRILYPSDADFANVGVEKYEQIRKHGLGIVESQWQHKNGRVFPVRIHATPLNVEHIDAGVIFIAQDLSIQHQLQERGKELHCLYQVLNWMRSQPTIDDLMQYLVAEMPQAWMYPGMCRVRVQWNERHYHRHDFVETPWFQQTVLFHHDQPAGKLQVYYLQEQPLNDEGPFLNEEREMIEAIGSCVSNYLSGLASD